MRTVLKFLAAAVALAVLVAAGYATWRRAGVQRALPARPDLTNANPALIDRIDSALAHSRAWWKPERGLGELAQLYLANEFTSEGTHCLERLVQLDPDSARWPYLLGHHAATFGDFDQARPHLEQAVRRDPGYLPAWIRLGDGLLKAGQPAQASPYYERALRADPRSSFARLGLARVAIAADRWAAAREHLTRAVEADPQFSAGWALLTSVHEHLNDAEAATRSRAMERQAGAAREIPDPWADELISYCYEPYRLRVAAAAMEDGVLARTLLERAVELAPQDSAGLRQLGEFCRSRGEIDAARSYLERAARANPKDPENWAYLVHLLDQIGDAAAADGALQSGLWNCPQSPSLRLKHGKRLAAKGRWEEASFEFEQSMRLRPEETEAYVEFATAQFRIGRVQPGVEALQRVLVIEPGHPVALTSLAFCSIGLGDQATARSTLHAARAQPRVDRTELATLAAQYQQRFGQSPW